MAARKIDRWKKISVDVNNSMNTNKADILESLSTVPDTPTHTDTDVESVSVKSNINTDNTESYSQNRSTEYTPDERLAFKVNKNVQLLVENKKTKEMTHKKTSFLISLENLAKLENFNRAHGGRVKGEFINTLLEEAFAELEEDPRWKAILNRNLDLLIDRLRSGTSGDW